MNKKIEDLLLNPRPGSKVADAEEFGIDLSLSVVNLRLTPQQRIEKLQGAMKFHDEVRRQGEAARRHRKER